ncbi:MAG: HAD family hydrolase [Spirochaetales bacterium]|nr:HAD family hydrolase [Spirochaetales bacterium]
MSKNRINTVLFDLDGTLTDPGPGITKSVQYSLRKCDIDVVDLAELEKFIGPPLAQSYVNFYAFSKEESLRAVDYYREYFSEKGLYENELYPGIPELLEELSHKGISLGLATSKPTVFAERILAYFELDRFFHKVIGSNMDNTRTDKKEIIDVALQELGKSPSEAIMIGDRMHDILGARAHSVKSVGVLYGYSPEGELEEIGPDFLVEDVDSLRDVLREHMGDLIS